MEARIGDNSLGGSASGDVLPGREFQAQTPSSAVPSDKTLFASRSSQDLALHESRNVLEASPVERVASPFVTSPPTASERIKSATITISDEADEVIVQHDLQDMSDMAQRQWEQTTRSASDAARPATAPASTESVCLSDKLRRLVDATRPPPPTELLVKFEEDARMCTRRIQRTGMFSVIAAVSARMFNENHRAEGVVTSVIDQHNTLHKVFTWYCKRQPLHGAYNIPTFEEIHTDHTGLHEADWYKFVSDFFPGKLPHAHLGVIFKTTGARSNLKRDKHVLSQNSGKVLQFNEFVFACVRLSVLLNPSLPPRKAVLEFVAQCNLNRPERLALRIQHIVKCNAPHKGWVQAELQPKESYQTNVGRRSNYYYGTHKDTADNNPVLATSITPRTEGAHRAMVPSNDPRALGTKKKKQQGATPTARRHIAFNSSRASPRWTSLTDCGPIAELTRRPVRYESRERAPDLRLSGTKGELSVGSVQDEHTGIPPVSLLQVNSLVADDLVPKLAKDLLKATSIRDHQSWFQLDGPYIGIELSCSPNERMLRINITNIYTRSVPLTLRLSNLRFAALQHKPQKLAPGAHSNANIRCIVTEPGEYLGALLFLTGTNGTTELFRLPLYIRAVSAHHGVHSAAILRPRWTESVVGVRPPRCADFQMLPSRASSLRLASTFNQCASDEYQSAEPCTMMLQVLPLLQTN
jgi:hypothetical protein